MTWNIIYFIIGIAAAVAGIWNLAQRRNLFLSIAGILWFIITLFTFIFSLGFWTTELLPGASIGSLILYVAIPVFVILAFFQRGNR
ncbi:MAG: hypothetical protein EHM28_01980 [Spirochaetaceae bacterium]|nr:MAG: hypothetical protein EHM28_01980 [Spirochaetaceae bacterium]